MKPDMLEACFHLCSGLVINDGRFSLSGDSTTNIGTDLTMKLVSSAALNLGYYDVFFIPSGRLTPSLCMSHSHTTAVMFN